MQGRNLGGQIVLFESAGRLEPSVTKLRILSQTVNQTNENLDLVLTN
jgi:gamma-glutamylcysteine synthetase